MTQQYIEIKIIRSIEDNLWYQKTSTVSTSKFYTTEYSGSFLRIDTEDKAKEIIEKFSLVRAPTKPGDYHTKYEDWITKKAFRLINKTKKS